MTKKHLTVGFLIIFGMPFLIAAYRIALNLHFNTILDGVLYDLPVMMEGLAIVNWYHWVTKEKPTNDLSK